MHPVSVPSQPFMATLAKQVVPRSAAVRKAIHFVNLRSAGRSSGNLAMNSIPKPDLGSETSGREDFSVGDKDAVVIVDHGSRRQESNLMLNDFVEMFRAKTSYSIVEPAHMDIPALAAEASKEHSNIPFIVTAPLGLHELMVDIMNDRIKYCLRHVAGDVDECTVCAGTGKCRLYS